MNKIGFGFLRLPKTGDESRDIDWALLNRMVDVFLAKGGTYFDTAYTYRDGMSEIAIRESVVKCATYVRDTFLSYLLSCLSILCMLFSAKKYFSDSCFIDTPF